MVLQKSPLTYGDFYVTNLQLVCPLLNVSDGITLCVAEYRG